MKRSGQVVQPQDLRCILQSFDARNVCSLGGRLCSKFCTEDEYIDEFAPNFFGGFLFETRTIVLEGIRVKGRRPWYCDLSRVMMAIPS